MTQISTIVIGAGWLGAPLAKRLAAKGQKVLATRRSEARCNALVADGVPAQVLDLSADKLDFTPFYGFEQLVLAFPPGVRRGNGDAYLSMLKRLRDGLAGNGLQKVLLLSSTGALKEADATLDEKSAADANSPLAQAERALLDDGRYQSAVLRLAGLFGPERYPGRFLAGKTDLPRGGAPVNLVHQADALGLSLAILQRQRFGDIFHAVAPQSYSRAHFYVQAAKLAGLTPPRFSDQTGGKRVVGDWTAQTLNYQYQIPDPLAWCQGAASGVEC
ncbi:NAD(P)-binding domain-containing protein [Gallaecimonas mangrovi]|uniref:NAD(P)-binding domain-containing protein n=1 Tax=Gallaecimonas mangrovi TaxID=2291597 RepID=UPI000E207971|nr:NAD(P)-binding domain-containing protein [Gallaecimonas mangrovi]